jgi:NAD+ synthetase
MIPGRRQSRVQNTLKTAIYQGRFPVNTIMANAEHILQIAAEVSGKGVELLIFPESALTGYVVQDLLLQEDFKATVQKALQILQEQLPKNMWVLIGTPFYQNARIFNAAMVFNAGAVQQIYAKQALPNHEVFDEQRYFTKGTETNVLKIKGLKIGIMICEDFWVDEITTHYPKHLDATVIINASPFFVDKREQRLARAQIVAKQLGTSILYAHQIGAQDEIIFDGGSFALDTKGTLLGTLPQFEVGLGLIEISKKNCMLHSGWQDHFKLDEITERYQALVFALQEYALKNRFSGVILGLSGGIDSALTLALAVQALGAENVEAVLMPSRFTQMMSIEDALQQAKTLGIKTHQLNIETLFTTFLTEVSPHFDKKEWDLTEENIQARLRGMILMALSNKSGKMVVTTTNKSELAVGYGTLYGDLAGGFALLKDVYKTEVYALAEFCNREEEIIPRRVIERAPSAELREDQTDQDSLPEYPLLDAIIKLYVEENLGVESMIAKGYPKAIVERIIKMIDKCEYKRQQAPIGPKVSKRAFGKDWRMPVTKG